MKIISILLIHSNPDLLDDCQNVNAFFAHLNEVYMASNRSDDLKVFFNLSIIDPKRLAVDRKYQQEIENELQDSEMAFFLFFEQAVSQTRDFLEKLIEQFKTTGRPFVHTYFKQSENPDQDVKDLASFIDDQLQHYHSIYHNLEGLKLDMLMQIKLQDLDWVKMDISDQNLIMDGITVMSLADVPAYTGQARLKKLREELEKVTAEYNRLFPLYLKNRNDQNISNSYSAAASRKDQLQKEINTAELDILDAYLDVLKKGREGKLTPRQIDALRMFEAGRAEDAVSCLPRDLIRQEMKQANTKADIASVKAEDRISELLQRISYQKTLGLSSEDVDKICEDYELCLETAIKHNQKQDFLLDYAKLLDHWNRHKEEGIVLKKLEYYCSNPFLKVDRSLQAGMNLWMSFYLRNSNQHSSALQYGTRAHKIYSELNAEDSVYIGELANSWGNLGVLYKDTQRFGQAEKAYLEALKIRQELAESNPDVYNSDLAKSWNNLGVLYKATQRFDQAEKAYLEALKIKQELVESNPDVYNSDLAKSWNNLGVLYKTTQRFDLAEKAYLEALKIKQELADGNPDVYNPYLAVGWNNLGLLYKATRRFDQAEKAYLEALKIKQELTESNPDVYNSDLAKSWNNLGVLYKATQRFDQAEKAYLEALKIKQELTEGNPDVYNPNLAVSWYNLGVLYKATQRFDQAEKAYLEALKIKQKLAEGNPDVYNPDLADTYWNLGLLYIKINKASSAIDSFDKAKQLFLSLDPIRYQSKIESCQRKINELSPL